MPSVTRDIAQSHNVQVHQAMLRLRQERSEKVQRIMEKIAGRDADRRTSRATDPTGNRGNTLDVVA